MLLQTGGGGTVTINGPGVLSIASGDQGFFVDTTSQTLKINAVLAGSGRLVWQGTSQSSGSGGSLYLLGNNTYTGGTTLDAGTLRMSERRALGTGTLTINNGSDLQVNWHDAVNNASVPPARISASSGWA